MIGRGKGRNLKVRPLGGGKPVIIQGTSREPVIYGREIKYKMVGLRHRYTNFGVKIGISAAPAQNKIDLVFHDTDTGQLLVVGSELNPGSIAGQVGASEAYQGTVCGRRYVYISDVDAGSMGKLDMGNGKLVEEVFPKTRVPLFCGSILSDVIALGGNIYREDIEATIRYHLK